MFDLNTHYDMICKIIHSKFSQYTYDNEDLIQDVCHKILKQNLGSNPFNPELSSASSYVYMIAEGILRKDWQRNRNNPIRNASAMFEEDFPHNSNDELLEKVLCLSLATKFRAISEDLGEVFDLSLQGFSRREMAEITPYSEYQIRQARTCIQEMLEDELIN